MHAYMNWLKNSDTINALVFLVLGVGVLYYSVTELPIGTLSRLGPGGAPAGLAVILIVFGLVMLVRSLRSVRPPVSFPLRTPIYMLGALLAFSFVVRLFGAIPAVAILTFVTTMVEDIHKPRVIVALIAILCFTAWFVFDVALGMHLAMFNWPF